MEYKQSDIEVEISVDKYDEKNDIKECTKELCDWKSWAKVFTKEQEYVIWGCTEFTEALLATVKDIMKIRYIVDSDKRREGTSFQGIPVHMPMCVKDEKNVKIIVTNRFSGTSIS